MMDREREMMDSAPAATQEDESVSSLAVADREPVKLRSYQQEMLEESLKRNIIVAMDTGSGKTHVAVFRVLAELERTTDATKLVWFLSPSVALSLQQKGVLSDDLPGHLVKSLTGVDNVDCWTEQRVWDAALTNVRVVVGTPMVLADALSHGFVKISRLALLVFDEAHRCIKNSPMNTIMKNFYHPAKAQGNDVPYILGLTASPVMNAKCRSLETIEANLDATAITPKHHRSELAKYVHPPQMTRVIYSDTLDPGPTNLCVALHQVAASYDFRADPYLEEATGMTEDIFSTRTLTTKKTYCSEQLKILLQKAKATLEQLGPSAAEWYVRKCIDRFNESLQLKTLVLPELTEREQKHLHSLFEKMLSKVDNQPRSPVHTSPAISDKVRCLWNVLREHASPSARGIVFVEQRVTVTALSHLLRTNPEFTTSYSVGEFVGMSMSSSRKSSVADLTDTKQHQHDLADFRSGKKNLMITTNVLEEGIDVSACNLVICFDPPRNLVSFVQRRGRARQKDSKFIVFLPVDDAKTDPSDWQRLESEMKEAYMDAQRVPGQEEEQDMDDVSHRVYRVGSTEALLTHENAKAHLHHFCDINMNSVGISIDSRPEFEVHESNGKKPFTASVTLPAFVHPDVRKASSGDSWSRKSTAIKDAAFEALIALHKDGLVNDNLLPLTKEHGPDPGQHHIDQPSVVQVSERQSSWRVLCHLANDGNANWHPSTVTLSLNDETVVSMLMWLPTPTVDVPPFPLFWNKNTTYMIAIQPRSGPEFCAEHQDLCDIRKFTSTMLKSVHRTHMAPNLDDFPVLFSNQAHEAVSYEDEQVEGFLEASTLLQQNSEPNGCGLIRLKRVVGQSFILSKIALDTEEDSDELIHVVSVTNFPKRKDFLHPLHQLEQNAAYTRQYSFPIRACTVDRLPGKFAIFAAFVPSILHCVDVALLAHDLQSTVLHDVGITDIALITEAISSRSAEEAGDYNRLEFLGDRFLKFYAVLHLMALHLNWPEGYLSSEKERLVSNNSLARAALKAGLDKYILNKPFTGSKWRPTYVSKVLASNEGGKREMSSKVLADVVEALIGAAFVDGGQPGAFKCIQGLLADEAWYSQSESIDKMRSGVQAERFTYLSPVEDLIGYHFDKQKLLLEAITHASLPYNLTVCSYERLEFLGDAVLDIILVPKLFAHPRKLKHWDLHQVHGALVNRHFLGYCCMSYSVELEKYDIVVENPVGGSRPKVKKSSELRHLYDYLRTGPNMHLLAHQSKESFDALRDKVDEALTRGKDYPWAELLAMRLPKFYSDMIESVLGAVFLDSRGDLAVCEAVLERFGILTHMRRFLSGDIEIMYPKTRLGELAVNDPVTYIVSKSDGADGSAKLFACTVKVGNVDVASVTGCVSRDEVEARAAVEAIEVLRGRAGQ